MREITPRICLRRGHCLVAPCAPIHAPRPRPAIRTRIVREPIVIRRTVEQVRYVDRPSSAATRTVKDCSHRSGENSHGLQVLPKLVTVDVG